MSPFASRHLRLIGPAAVAATLSLGSLPAFAQSAPSSTANDCSAIHFELANPAPGSRVEIGNLVLQGIAFDTRAQQGEGLGIDRIDFFLDNRDQGGTNVGTALPGTTSGPFGPNSFQTTVSLPNMMGGHDLVAYAHSSVTGQTEAVTVPIVLGQDPSKLTTPMPSSDTTMCIGGGGATTTEPAAGTSAPSMTAPSMTTTPNAAASTLVLSVVSPMPGDELRGGAYRVVGDAVDHAAATDSGVDKIDIYLGERDAGGLLLASAQLGPDAAWETTINLPSNQPGVHQLWFYAHSSVNDAVESIAVPISLDVRVETEPNDTAQGD